MSELTCHVFVCCQETDRARRALHGKMALSKRLVVKNAHLDRKVRASGDSPMHLFEVSGSFSAFSSADKLLETFKVTKVIYDNALRCRGEAVVPRVFSNFCSYSQKINHSLLKCFLTKKFNSFQNDFSSRVHSEESHDTSNFMGL